MGSIFRYEKIRFGTAGVFNTGLDFVMLNILVFVFGAYPILANTMSVSIGITISYLLNHFFVFQSKEKLQLKKYIQFFCITGFSSLIIQNSIITGFAIFFDSSLSHSLFIINLVAGNDFLELNIAKASAVLVGMVWNFTLYKYVIFRKKADSESKPSHIDE